MKHALCSLVLLVMISAAGLTVGSKSASAASVNIADRWDEIQNSKWGGSWRGDQHGTTGSAEFSLKRRGPIAVHVKITVRGGVAGDHTYGISGKAVGNMLLLERTSSEVTLFLSEEDGVLMLKGGYKVLTGKYAGETGAYYFKMTK